MLADNFSVFSLSNHSSSICANTSCDQASLQNDYFPVGLARYVFILRCSYGVMYTFTIVCTLGPTLTRVCIHWTSGCAGQCVHWVISPRVACSFSETITFTFTCLLKKVNRCYPHWLDPNGLEAWLTELRIYKHVSR